LAQPVKAQKYELLVDNLEETNATEGNLEASEVAPKPSKATLKSTFRLLITLNMLKVVALIIVSGIVAAVYSGLLVLIISNTIEDQDSKLTKALYCMIVFGAGEILGSLALGKVIDKLNNRAGVF
jgi:predicted MFS family arabinose efflux permease